MIATLTGYGYQEVDAEEADFHVTYHVSSQERYYNRGPRFGFGVSTGGYYGGGYRGGSSVRVGATYYSHNYEEGSLIIDIIERDSGELVWRGWQNKNVYQEAYSEAAVLESVKLILEKFAYVEIETGQY